MKKLLKVLIWYPGAIVLLLITIHSFNSLNTTKQVPGLIRQEIISLTKNPTFAFAALPQIAFEIKTAMATQDARPIIINKYLEYYNSPMKGMGNFITSISDEYGVDPYIIVAIAQQESNLGKITPTDCYNAWGWGIHSNGKLCFDNWDQGITKFTLGIADNYHAFGLYTPEEIMSKYVPHSPEGAWASGVTQFLTELQTGIW